MRLHLQESALAIYNLCVQHNIVLDMEWIYRTVNQKADYITKIIDWDDCLVSHDFFLMIDKLWGLHTVGRFANQSSNHLVIFSSKYWVPGSEAVDTFAKSCTNDLNWWLPPVNLVAHVLRQIICFKKQRVLC